MAPAPVSALWVPPDTITVTFNQLLLAGPLANVNWWADIDGFEYDCFGAVAAGAVVTITIEQIGIAQVGRRVTYTPPPFDVIGLATGIPAAAFTDFPVT